MAMSATITTSPATTAYTEADCTGIIVITNSSAFPVNILSVAPYVKPTSGAVGTINTGVSIGPVSNGPNVNLTVPASSTLTLTFPFTCHAPSNGILGTGTGTYDVGAVLYCDASGSDAVFSPTAATLTVNLFQTFPTAQQ